MHSLMAKENNNKKKKKHSITSTQQDHNTQICGDILEKIISHVPLIYLISPSQVSKSWKGAISPSLLHINKLKPWLVIHKQSTRPPFTTSTSYLTYDPRTPNRWIKISTPLSHSSSIVRSSHSTLLYTLSPTILSISTDSLHLNWTHLPPPSTWRTDPIVAVSGCHVIVVGGACNFDDNPAPMEIFNLDKKTWEPCNSIPKQLNGIACSQWVSISIQRNNLYVTKKMSGTTFTFNSEKRIWDGPITVRPDSKMYFCSTGFCKDRFLLVSLVGEAEKVKGVRVYQVGFDFDHQEGKVKDDDIVLLSEMSEECVEMLKSGEEFVWSIEVCFVGSFVYVCNGGVVVVGEWGDCGVWKWWWVKNVGVGERSLVERMVFSGGDVGVDDVWRAKSCEGCEFELIELD